VSFSSWFLVSNLCIWTLNWLSNFQFFLIWPPNLVNFSPYNYTSFSVWSLILNFFNQVPNCPSNFNIYVIWPLIWPNWLLKIAIRLSNFNFFQLKLKLTSKIIFSFNWVLNKINWAFQDSHWVLIYPSLYFFTLNKIFSPMSPSINQNWIANFFNLIYFGPSSSI
jgi:hypothetical protein